MGKITKIAVKYRAGNLPPNLSELLLNADENDLRILIAVMMLADTESGVVSLADLPERLGLEKSEVDASVKFWRGAGVLGTPTAVRNSEEKTSGMPSAHATGATKPTTHRNGAVERTASLGQYSSSELADLMEKRRISAQFVDEAQRILGKVFRSYDTGILVGIVDQLGMEEEAVLAILAYAASKGKKTLRYAEQMAMALYDEGITDTADVLERISRIERSGEVIAKIRTLFGIGARELTATEKKLFTTWTEKYAYEIDVIRMAYDITVDTIQKPVPKYTNSILEKWHTEGLRSASDVEQYIEAQESEKSGTQSGVGKSYDVEDFFEAALQRSYDNLK